MKRRFQFSIATLLAIVTVSALGAHSYATRHRLAVAQDDLSYAKSALDVGTGTDQDVYEASVKLIHAEQAVPFSDRRGAYARHLELMEQLEAKHRYLPRTGVYGGGYDDWVKECNEKADAIHVWVEEAQRWLSEGR